MTGVKSFDPPFVTGYKVWFDGAYLVGPAGGGVPPVDFNEVIGAAFSEPTAAGSHVVWRPYRAEESARKVASYEFLFEGDWDDQGDYRRVEQAASRAEPVEFTFGLRVTDTFDADGVSEYTLTRRRAAGIVAGVSEVTHETKFFLDGVLTPGAATLGAAQKVTSNTLGVLAVEYTPLHWVLVQPRAASIRQANDLRTDFGLLEVIQGLPQ